MAPFTSKRQHQRRHQGSSGTRFCILSKHVLLISLALGFHTTMVAGQDLSDYFSTPVTPRPAPTQPPATNITIGANETIAPSEGNATATRPPEILPETLSPSFITTLAPTTMAPSFGATTLAPTTVAPTFIATLAPTVVTISPTILEATGSPTFAPSIVTNAPITTDTPTLAPTVKTLAPTNATASPTIATASPTEDLATTSPTTAPTQIETVAPTIAEVITLSPTIANVTEPPGTDSPTEPQGSESPTTDPGGEIIEELVSNLRLDLVGMNAIMGVDAESEWKMTTEEHTKDYYRQNPNLEITDVVTTVTVLTQKLGSQRRRGLLRNYSRNLQTTVVTVTYNQEIRYRTQNPDRDPPQAVALAPFQTPADLEKYLASLQESSSEFGNVMSINPAIRDSSGGDGGGGGGIRPTRPPTPETDDGLGMGVIIGIVVGCVVGVAVILGVGYFVMQRGDDGGYVSTGKTPPTQFDLNSGPDEVSTLAEPHTNNRTGVNNTLSGESAAGYGDQSVATVDYDYSKAYGGGGDTSVSSAGGTFGSQTHTQVGGATLASATGANGSPLDTFPEGGPGFRGSNPNVREELIDIYAPPGKLGVVIDTPDDGAPVVHAVKDSSVIADKLQVGDKLVAVDDEDVRSMTAIKVSKLISRKSANPSRKLSIIRTVVVDE